MTSEELAAEVEAFVARCRSRVTGTGDEQYGNGPVQKFEGLPLMQLIDWALEEIEDVVNYSTMMAIRLQRVRKTLAEHLE